MNAGTKWADYLSYGATSRTDLAGAARLSGKFLDIGCYEIDQMLVVSNGVSLMMHKSARLKALRR